MNLSVLQDGQYGTSTKMDALMVYDAFQTFGKRKQILTCLFLFIAKCYYILNNISFATPCYNIHVELTTLDCKCKYCKLSRKKAKICIEVSVNVITMNVKRKVLSVSEKLEILRKYDENSTLTQKQLSNSLGIPSSILRMIIKNRDSITTVATSSGGYNRRKLKCVLTCYGTKIVLQWLKEGKMVINKISQLGPMDPSTNSRSKNFSITKKSLSIIIIINGTTALHGPWPSSEVFAIPPYPMPNFSNF
ncbi:hypothetical protein ANN_07887 [Periplaneta americana]|uniref:HTH psq-type domain-containing protein n=1 Tax=Periplaneta americana TaxID=6978 RepID=A0ABQ8T116_PERAM|nr:hypothetical protein ANN_07887 [Periplaneta americana]